MITMHIGILACGSPTSDLASTFGTYAEMTRVMLSNADPGFSFRVYECETRGEFPTTIDECDAYAITGSPHGVYDRLPFMCVLESFIQKCAAQRKKIVGICFGHQILAAALGGRVEKSRKGWGMGPSSYTTTPQNPLSQCSSQIQSRSALDLFAVHQDQVVELPPSNGCHRDGVRVLAWSAHCEFACLMYGNWAFSVQGHPEFTAEYEHALLSKIADAGAADRETVRDILVRVELAREEGFVARCSSDLACFMAEFIKGSAPLSISGTPMF
eukprot:ANDGO_01742.mRNA.1 Gamma-glutamyl peptidase 3